MTNENGVLQDSFSQSFQAWSELMNCDYTYWCANRDSDLFINTLEIYAEQGIDGFLPDPDTTIYPRISELLAELDIPWMSVLSTPIDQEGKLTHPSIGFDQYGHGKEMAQWLIDYQKENWPDAEPSEIGMLCIDYSTVPLLHERLGGQEEAWKEAYPGNEANYFVSDAASQNTGLTADAGYNLSGPVIAAHPEIEYWLVCGLLDDVALGVTRAFETAGKDDKAAIIVMGGDSLAHQWDAGEDSCWRAALYTAESVYSEPIFNGLYAMMTGQATAETLWPEWINHAAGEEYALFLLPSCIITKDNYQSYMAYCDLYSGIKRTDYVWDGREYDMRAEVPEWYKAN